MKVYTFDDGILIHGSFPDKEVVDEIKKISTRIPIVIVDPPYGKILSDESWDKTNLSDVNFCKWMIDWTNAISSFQTNGDHFYCWGGTGIPRFRPFFRYLIEAELQTPYTLSNLITWKKKRAYGLAHNYLFTREELGYFVFGDPKKPNVFNIPLLDEKRGYPGYNKKYPAKSEYLRRSNVWADINELFSGKLHSAQKPDRVIEIPIEVNSNKGDFVLDTFAGSGTLGAACRKLGRKFIMVEKDPLAIEIILSRLRGSNSSKLNNKEDHHDNNIKEAIIEINNDR